MTLRLILTRHAKSSWDAPALDDHARRLNGRGRRSAEAIGRWLAEQGAIPDEVLSSDAVRTRETWERMRDALGGELEPRWSRSLYLAGAQAMLDALRKASGQTVMMIGHNPGIGQFANMIVGQPPRHPRFRDYPTGATLIADFDIADWSRADWGKAAPVAFTVPRDLGVD